MKVLVIEDNVYKAVQLTRALKNLGISDINDIREAADKESALHYLEKEDFDLILLDMFFPEKKDGWEEPWCGFKVLDWMQEHKKMIPVICTSTVRTNLFGYDCCVGQMLYGQDDREFRLKELIDQIPYLFE